MKELLDWIFFMSVKQDNTDEIANVYKNKIWKKTSKDNV